HIFLARKEQSLPAGQELGSLRLGVLLADRERLRGTTSRRNAGHDPRRPLIEGGRDDVVLAPCAAAGIRGVRQRGHHPAIKRQFLQLAAFGPFPFRSEESDRTALW